MSAADRNAPGGVIEARAIRPPIFIHGTLGRSGTNYLARLLALHPECALASFPEDWFLSGFRHLERYVASVARTWRQHDDWEIRATAETELLACLGRGLLSFLGEPDGNRRLVSKTPDVTELEHFFALFPDAYLLILVRDGRSVAESSARSFGTRREDVARWWAGAANQVLEFDRANTGRDLRYRIVRYEDLAGDPPGQMAEILRFLDLDADAYDATRLDSLPLYGSSTSMNASGEWEWQVAPAPKGDDPLAPLERWSEWSRSQHERFNWIAAPELESFGYEPVRAATGRARWWLATAAWAFSARLRRFVASLGARVRGGAGQ